VPGALYRTTPSRGAIARLANRRDSFVEVILEVAGETYTARLLINGHLKSPKTEAYLVDGSGHPITEGKVKDYAEAVARLFPPESVYLSSAFAAQGGRGSFLSIPRAERKALFVAMLGAGRLELLAKAAGDRAAALKPEIDAKRAGAATALELAGSVGDRAVGARTAADNLAGVREDLDLAEKRADESQRALETWQTTSAELRVATVDAQGAEGRVRDKLGFAKETADRAAKRELDLSAERRDIANRLQGQILLKADAKADEGCTEALRNLDAEMRDHRALEAAHREELATWTAARQKAAQRYVELRSEWHEAKAAADRELKAAVDRLDTAEGAARRLGSVPCEGAGEYAGCPLIIHSVEAQDKAPKLREQLGFAARRLDALDAQPEELLEAEAAGKALGPEPAAPDPEAYRSYEVAARECREVIAKAEAARTKLATHDAEAKRVQEIDGEMEALANELTEHKAAIDGLITELVLAEEATHKAAGSVMHHNSIKPEPPDTADVSRLRALDRTLAGELAAARQRLETSQDAAATAKQAQAEIATLLEDLDDWQHLAKAFGKNGIQALEIDAAGPEVSALANELLHSCYGPRFTLSLETTALKADGKGSKETFDLRVIDSERGTEGDAGDLSGGEKVLVGEALALAIACFNARRSSIPMDDLFRDECAGALSAANAGRYVEMLRRALELGGFHRCFFIAHQPELWSYADARIRFEGGGCRVDNEGTDDE